MSAEELNQTREVPQAFPTPGQAVSTPQHGLPLFPFEASFLMHMSAEALFHGWLDILDQIQRNREKQEKPS